MVDFSKLFETDEEAALKNYAARLPVAEVDPQTGFANYTNPAVSELKLPVQGIHSDTYIPTQFDLKGPIQWFPPITGGYEGAKRLITNDVNWPSFVEKVTGSNGVPREQLWPEKMVRSGLTLAGDVMSGRVATGVGLRRGDYSDDPNARQPLSDLIERTQDMAGLAAGGSITGAGLKAEGPGAISRGAKALKDRLNEVFAEENHNLRSDVIGGTAEVRKSPDGKGWEIWNKDKNELWVKQEDGMSKFEAQKQAENLNKQSSDMAIRLNADNEAGTVIAGARNSLASRLQETMPEILNKQRASEGYEAAIRDPETKKLYTGMWHEEVMDKMAKDKGIPRDQLPDNIVKGYIDNNGRFLTEAQLEKRSQSKSAMFRSDDEVGTALAAIENTNRKPVNLSREQLERMNINDLDRMAYGHVQDQKLTLNPDKINIKYKDDLVNPEDKFKKEGMKWAKSVKFDEPVQVSIGQDGKFYLEDGHHRYFAAKKLGKPLNVVIEKIDGKPIETILKHGVLMSDDIVGTALAGAEATAPRFYSHVENLINNATTMVRNAEGKRVEVPQTKFNANEVLPYLKNKGATAEEIEALKLPEFLEGKKSITKDELAKHIEENKVWLNENWLPNIPKATSELKEFKKRMSEKYGDDSWDANLNKDETIEFRKILADNNKPNTPARFAQYQLPGGENYRELLMSLKDNPKVVKRVEEINNEISEIRKQRKDMRDKLDYPEMNDKYLELEKRNAELAQERLDLEQSFTHSHWPNNKDVLVHARMNDRNIQVGSGPNGYNLKSLHAEEIQSDWLQKGNSEGFKLPAKEKAKLEPEFNKIDQKILKHAEDTKDESIVANPDIKDAIKTAIEKKVITKAEGDLYLRYSASENIGAVPDAPFKSQWSDLMVKRLIRQAAEEGKDAISWTPGQAQIDRYPGLQQHFDKVEYNPKTQEFKAYGKAGNITKKVLSPKELVDYIGKEATDKLINNPSKKIKDSDNAMEFGNNHILENADLKVGGEFHKKFYDEILVNKVNAIAKKFGGRVEEKEIPISHTNPDMRKIQEAMGNSTKQKIWVLKLTPEMKKHALEKGFSMFETGLPLPTNTEDKKYKLIPVSHNPFLSNRLM